MNFIDIILIIISTIVLVVGLFLIILAIKDGEYEIMGGFLFVTIVFLVFTLFIPFLVIDKNSGSTIGTITSVDRSFWGYTKLYIKTTETNEEEYCIEYDDELILMAQENLGNKVKISYDERVGFYSVSKCHQSPIIKIESLT